MVFERRPPLSWRLLALVSGIGCLLTLLWGGMVGTPRLPAAVRELLTESPLIPRTAAEVTFGAGFLLGTAAYVGITFAARRRFGRAEIHRHHVAFDHSFSASRYADQVVVNRASMRNMEVVSTPSGIVCRDPSRPLFEAWFFPLFVPTRGDEQQGRALRLLQGRDTSEDWSGGVPTSRCQGCASSCLPRRSLVLCPACAWRGRRRRTSGSLVAVLLVVLTLLLWLLWKP